MKLTLKQAVATLHQLDREHQYDMGAANGMSREEVDAKMRGAQPMDKSDQELWNADLYGGKGVRSRVVESRSSS